MGILAKFCYSGRAPLVVLTWREGWGGCSGVWRKAAGSKFLLDVTQSFEMLMLQGWVQRVLGTHSWMPFSNEGGTPSSPLSCLEFPGGLSQLQRATSASHTPFMRNGFQVWGIKGMGCLPAPSSHPHPDPPTQNNC